VKMKVNIFLTTRVEPIDVYFISRLIQRNYSGG